MDPATADVTPSPRVGTDQRLIDTVEAHAQAEAASIAAYRDLAASLTDTVAVLVLRLIIEDEERHHATFRRMARLIRHESLVMPPPTADRPLLTTQDRETLEAAIQAEIEGARELRTMAQAYPKLCEGLVALVLELMARDSEKHEQMLRFTMSRLQSSSRGS